MGTSAPTLPLAGRTAFVTGAAGGIGAAVVAALGAQGAARHARTGCKRSCAPEVATPARGTA